MDINTIKTKKQLLLRGRFVTAYIALTFFNLLVLYFLPGNIYINLAFVATVFFTFKLLVLSSRNIFIYSLIYLIIALVVKLSNNYVLSYRWLNSISSYILLLFVLSTLVYIYEEKLKGKITFKKRRIVYSYLSLFSILIFLLSAIFFNIVYIKVSFFNNFYTEKYFNEVGILEFNTERFYNEMELQIEEPDDYNTVKDIFKLEGWAIDGANIPGTKIDYVGVYLDNKPRDGGEFISRCDFGIEREDIGVLKGDKFKNSGFFCKIDSNKIEDGLRKLYIYFHSNNFEWKYETLELFINNEDSLLFEDILDKKNKDIELEHSKISEDGEEIIIEEGERVLKYIRFPVNIESYSDYLVSFQIKKIKNLDNSIHLDFFGDGYSPEQDYYVEHTYIDEEYKEVKRLINVGNVPPGTDIYFRIFTNSAGSAEIKDLAVYKVSEKY